MSKTLIYYSAPWCQPCTMFGPIVEQFVKDTGVNLVKINIDEDPESAIADGVSSIPVLVLEDEKLNKLARIQGAKPRPFLDKELLHLL